MKLLALTITGPNGDPIKLKGPGGIPTGGFDGGPANGIIAWGLTLLLVSATILALFFLIWGGVGWITSGGDKSKLQAARNKMVYAIIGLVIAFLSFFIVTIIGRFFNADLLGIGQ